MINRFQLLVLLLFIMSACNDDENPGPVIFTFETQQQFSGTERRWVTVSDQDGTELGTQQLVPFRKLEFHSNKKPDVLEVTLITSFGGSNIPAWGLTTYKNVEVNDSWTTGVPSQPTVNTPVGTAQFKVTNVPQVEENFYGVIRFLTPKGPQDSGADIALENGIFTSSVLLFSNPAKVVVVGFRDGQRVYKTLNSVSAGTSVELDLNDFVPYETVLSVPGDHYRNMLIFGYDENDDAYLLSLDDFYLHGIYNMGYVAGFQKYLTVVNQKTSVEGKNFSFATYFKKGTSLETLTYPEVNTEFTHTNLANYSAVNKPEHIVESTQWGLGTMDYSIQWTIHGRDLNGELAKKLPSKVLEDLPNVAVGDIGFGNVTYQLHLSGTTSYNDWIAKKFKGMPESDTFEYYEILVSKP